MSRNPLGHLDDVGIAGLTTLGQAEELAGFVLGTIDSQWIRVAVERLGIETTEIEIDYLRKLAHAILEACPATSPTKPSTR